MQITGIKRGKTIELRSELDLPDGCEVELVVIKRETTDDRRQKIEADLLRFYQTRSPEDIEFDEEWGDFAHQQMEETLTEEGL